MNPSRRRRVVGIAGAAITAATLASAACTPDDVTRAPASISAESPRLTASPADIGAAAASLGDARSRMAPSLERLAADAELTDRLKAVEQAVSAGDVRALDRALARADRALARVREVGDVSMVAEVDAISFALADARRLLSRSSKSATARTSTSTEARQP
jgi:hypothetical protein